jgi:EpsI family protein
VKHLIVLASTGALLASGPVIAWWSQSQSETVQMHEIVMPPGAAGWSGPSVSQVTWRPVFHGAVTGMGTYQKEGHNLHLYIGYYPEQKQGSELIFYENRISNEDLWRTVHLQGSMVDIGGLKVLEQEIKSTSGGHILIWYWYRVAGVNTTNPYMAKGLQLLGVIAGKPQASVIAVAGEIADANIARQSMRGFISAIGPSILQMADGDFE